MPEPTRGNGLRRSGGYNETRIMGWPLRSLLVAVVLTTAACARPEDPPAAAYRAETPSVAQAAAPAESSRPRIVFLGDSLTAGLGLPRAQSVPSLIQVRLDTSGYTYEVVNAGVSGDTSAGGLRRLDWALDGDVDVLVVELGANDGLRGLPAAQMKENLDRIISRAKERRIAVILTGMEAPPNYGPVYTSEFRQVFRDLADEHEVTFVPFFLEGVAGIPRLNNADGIHPNAAGAKIIEQTIWRVLEPILERPAKATQ
jgi:acyl-CoA thioesterase I